jgi:hypothetical protein
VMPTSAVPSGEILSHSCDLAYFRSAGIALMEISVLL